MRRALVFALMLAGCKAEPPKTTAAPAPEPEVLALNGKPLEASFGLGEGVTYSMPDEKRFTFKGEPSKVVIIHFKARDISEREVVVSVNGSEVANVPPDSIATDREHQALVPQALLKEAENALVFRSTRHPAGKETWRVWGIWLEAASLPPVTNPLAEAQAAVDAAKKLQASGTLTPEQKFQAWKHYRTAHLFLETVRERPADLYDEVQRQLKALDPDQKP